MFKIVQADFEIILFIHLNKHLDRARGTLGINLIVDYFLPLQMKSFGLIKLHTYEAQNQHQFSKVRSERGFQT